MRIILTKKKYRLICILCIAFFCSCGKGVRITNEANFPISDILAFENITLDESLNILDIVPSENFLLLHADIKGNGNQIYVVDKESKELLYSFAPRGHGSDETMAMDIVQTTMGDTISIIDQAKYKVHSYIIDRNGATKISDMVLNVEPMGPLQEVYQTPDSILLFNTLSRELMAYDIRTKEIIHTFSLPLYFKETDPKEYGKYAFHFSHHNGELVLGFREANKLLKGSFDRESGISFFCEANGNKDLSNFEKDDDYMHYVYVDMCDNNVIAQYMGRSKEELMLYSRVFGPSDKCFPIEIYNRELAPVKFLIPNASLLRIKFDHKDCSLYSWNPDASNVTILKTNL